MPGPQSLDPRRVDAWRIERQLLGRTRAADPVEVAERLVGVQAQVTSSAALAIAIRSMAARGRPARTSATAEALAGRRLVRSWAMRGTLHLFAASDVPTVAAALGRREQWRRPAWLRWLGVTESEMERLIQTIGEVLDDGVPRTRAELATEIGARLGERSGRLLLGSWGSALKIASDHRYLVQAAGHGAAGDGAAGDGAAGDGAAGDGAAVRFVRASRWIRDWREEDPERALATLVERHLAAYGPATFQEVRRWWGLAVSATLRAAVRSLGDAVTEVRVGGVTALARTVDLDAIERTRPTRGAVHLVGGFDPFIVGGGLRDRLLPRAHLARVSRTAGWISPVVLIDGKAAGVWDARKTARGLAITVDPFDDVPARRKASIAVAAVRIAGAHGLPVSVEYGRVFTGKSRRLAIDPADA